MDGVNIDQPLAYHTGLDELYRSKVYLDADHAFTITEGNELQFVLEMDVNQILDGISFLTENASHTTPAGSESFMISERIVNNLADKAFFKVPF